MKFTKRLLLPVFISVSFSALAQNDARVQAYIDKYKDLAILEQKRTGIPAAIKLAQGIHETAAGTSELCQNANNHFGIKCKATWTGETYTYTDDRKDECFRKYGDDITSYKDHSDFLYKNPRYSTLFTYSVDDYKSWSHGLKKAGYATNPQYAVRLIETIEKYNLNQYTQIAMLSKEPEVLYASNTQDIKMVMPGETPKETTTVAVPATASVYASGKSTAQQEKSIEYYTTGQLNNIRGFYAPKGTMLLEYAIKNKIRYSKLLENNDLPDAPLEADMFIYLDKKHKKGLEPTTTVQEGESLIQISQRTGVQLSQLKMFNKLVDGVEPKPGSVLQLQSEAANAPEVYIPSSKPVATTPLARKANTAEEAYVVVKNSQAGTPEPTPYKQQPTSAANTTAPAPAAPAPARNTVVPAQQPVAAATTARAPEVIEDNSNLSPYEKLKRHMDKQVSNTSSYNETRMQETVSAPAADPYVTTPARNTAQPAASQAPSRQSSGTTTSPKATANKFHTVKKGETLTGIAQKHGVTVKQLQDWNKVSAKTLKAGQKLKVSK